MVANMQVVHNILNDITEFGGKTSVKTEILIAA